MTLFNSCQAIEQHISTLLAGISVANGYETDIGVSRVYRGKRKIEDADVPCAVVLTGEDRIGDNVGRTDVLVYQDFVLGGYAACDPDHPNDTAHAIIRDIKRAIFAGGPNFDRQVKAVRYAGKDIGPRADGMPIVFAIVHVTVEYAEALRPG